MPRKKKVVEDKVIKSEEITEITDDLKQMVQEEVNKESSPISIGEFGEKEENKSKKKWYQDCGSTWECSRIILRIDDKDYTKTYDIPVSISKNKLNKLTKYTSNNWMIIDEIRETETDLVFVGRPINY